MTQETIQLLKPTILEKIQKNTDQKFECGNNFELVGYVNKCVDYTGSVISDDKHEYDEMTVAVYIKRNNN